MSEWHCEIVEIKKVEKHPNADKLSIAYVNGDYPVVIKTGDYKIGDIASYVCIDTVVPDTEEYHFLSPNTFEQYEEVDVQGNTITKNRPIGKKYAVGSVPERHRVIKAKKILGVYSMGILFPPVFGLKIGDSIVDTLKLTKFEEQEEDNINGPKLRGANAEKTPTHFTIPYYDIESVRKYSYLLDAAEANPFKYQEAREAKEVVLREKLHGCLHASTKIQLANGKFKAIRSIVPGDIILGQNEFGKIVNTKVVHKFDNGKGGNWLKISGDRTNSGSGGHTFSITCTDNHKFYRASNNDYVEAKNLSIGDKVSMTRYDWFLTPIQEQILLGKILGDGTYYSSEVSGCITYNHCEDQKEYLDFTNKSIGSIWFGENTEEVSGFGSKMYKSKTVYTNLIKEKFESFIKDGRKTVPDWVENKLNPLGIAFWYMDDGNLSHHKDQLDRCNFSTCGFDIEECNVLIRALKKFDIEAKIETRPNGNESGKMYNKIHLNAFNSEKLFLLISPYIPKCMQYKLPERFRGNSHWEPTQEEFKTPTNLQEITGIEVLTETFVRHDIETETHNYFANGILVHNCNFMSIHDGERLFVKSRNFFKKESDIDSWWEAAYNENLKEKLSKYPFYAFFGELIGLVKGFRYDTQITDGKLVTKVKFFDIYDTKSNRYLDDAEFQRICDELELETAPVLYRGTWLGFDEMKKFAEGMSKLNKNHLIEGFVVKPPIEEFSYKLQGRLQLKLVGEGYSINK